MVGTNVRRRKNRLRLGRWRLYPSIVFNISSVLPE